MFLIKMTDSKPETFIPSDRIEWWMTINFLSSSLPQSDRVSKNVSLSTLLPSMYAPVFDVIYMREYPNPFMISAKSVCSTKSMI